MWCRNYERYVRLLTKCYTLCQGYEDYCRIIKHTNSKKEMKEWVAQRKGNTWIAGFHTETYHTCLSLDGGCTYQFVKESKIK